MEWHNYVVCKQLVVNLPKEEILGEEVKNEPVFSKCERKPQSQLVKVFFSHESNSRDSIVYSFICLSVTLVYKAS